MPEKKLLQGSKRRKNSISIAGAMVIAILCAVVSFFYLIENTFINPYSIVCDLVSKKIYLSDAQLGNWKALCVSRAKLVTPFSSKNLIIQDIGNAFELLNVSHLEIYDSKEVKNIWTGVSSDTGMQGDFVDSEMLVFKVHRGSPAEKAGIRRGDIVKSINGENPNAWSISQKTGRYVLHRAKKSFEVNISEGSFQRNDSVTMDELKNHTVLVTIPSFRGDFFSVEKVDEISRKIQNSKSVIVDLRGNSGGNFVAGLRLLSLFICEPKRVGRILKPRSINPGLITLANDLSDDHQIESLEKNSELILETYKSPFCYKGAVKVLIDGKTSSVAEMVAQGLKELRKSAIEGAPSHGQLLVGVWYPLDELGHGVQISIPEAYYQSHEGFRIEGQGVRVDRVLHYNLPEMIMGTDSWVEALQRIDLN
jgi:carboxyl-terminal processing protease